MGAYQQVQERNGLKIIFRRGAVTNRFKSAGDIPMRDGHPRRAIHIILMMCLLTGALSNLPTQSWAEGKTGLARYKALFGNIRSRKIAINPSKSAAGIKTGLVVAYGHIIPPPYQLEWVDGKLMVNGVQVEPSLVKEREDVLPAVTPEQQRMSDRRREIKKAAEQLFVTEINTKPLEEVHANVIALIKKSSDVFENPQWSGRDTLIAHWAGTTIKTVMSFPEKPRIVLSQEEIDRRARQAQETSLSRMKTKLGRGEVLVFTSVGGQGDGRDYRNEVNEIMSKKGLAEEQRIEMLKDKVFGGDYGMALDVIENYSPEEWKTK
jgi:hypothetical protein